MSENLFAGAIICIGLCIVLSLQMIASAIDRQSDIYRGWDDEPNDADWWKNGRGPDED